MSLFGGTNGTLAVTSLGHNYSDDNACSSYFTDGSDRNSLNDLTTAMGSLDTSGVIPTYALLASSPAIDGGATVSGILTDARGVARPQCNAYDVGAYEYDDECSAINGSSSSSGGSNSSGSGGGGAGSSSGSGQGGSTASSGTTAAAPYTGLSAASPLLAITFLGSGLVGYLGYKKLKKHQLI